MDNYIYLSKQIVYFFKTCIGVIVYKYLQMNFRRRRKSLFKRTKL